MPKVLQPGEKSKAPLPVQARNKAVAALQVAFADEFRELLRQERVKLGLSPDAPRGRPSRPLDPKLLQRIVAMSKKGASTDDIALALINDGIPTPGGKKVWDRAVIAKILRDAQAATNGHSKPAPAKKAVAKKVPAKKSA